MERLTVDHRANTEIDSSSVTRRTNVHVLALCEKIYMFRDNF